jgi:branched-chain amino acid transport system ATP-binding protein
VTDRLELEGVRAGYGGAVVIEDSLARVDEGECVALLGRNGVGKTNSRHHHHGVHALHAGAVRGRGRRSSARLPSAGHAGIAWSRKSAGRGASLTVMSTCLRLPGPGVVGGKRASRSSQPWPSGARIAAPALRRRAEMLAIARALVTNPRCSCSTSRWRGWPRW